MFDLGWKRCGQTALFGVLWLLQVASSLTAVAQEQPRLFVGLGDHQRSISTKSAEAQAFFNQGLAFLYGFNHDEAIRSFEHAAKLDPQCAAIFWALALAHGPHINLPVVDEQHAAEAWAALTKARQLANTATPVEQDLIAALSKRYAQPQPEDRQPLDQAYAAAMRELWKKYPQDADIGALFAESLMDLWPWDLWTSEGKPQPDTPEILQTLETVMEQSPRHPLALHLYIHAVEASPHPEKARTAADRLRTLQPGLGHMVHMPSHIDVRLGAWQAAIEANQRAVTADAKYRELSPDQNFYRGYMAHNHHMLAFAALMQGQQRLATDSIRRMLAEMPDDWVRENAMYVDGLFAMPYEVHLRFGRWDDMLQEPEPIAELPVARAFRLYARGVAYAAQNQLAAARQEQQQFQEAKAAIPDDTLFLMNTAADILGIADRVLEGEIRYRAGDVEPAFTALREAVQREDRLRYIEPPDWILPARHVLGATLMDAGHYAEAEQVYRADLQRHPHNGWSLHDLARSLHQQEKFDAARAVREQFEAAWKHADTPLTSSCFCLPAPK